MKSVKRFSALLTSIIMTFSLIIVSASDAEIKIIKEVTPETMDWSAEEVAYIDFSEIPDGLIEGPVTGNGLSLLTNESSGTARGSNIAEDGYVLLGKDARQNDNPADMEAKPTVNGAIYIRIDKPVEEKADAAYAVKIDYYGGGRLTVNSGSYIDIRYSTSESNEKLNSPRKTLGGTYNSGKVETMYILLPDADFAEKIRLCL